LINYPIKNLLVDVFFLNQNIILTSFLKKKIVKLDHPTQSITQTQLGLIIMNLPSPQVEGSIHG
jgi:hypothetical protein